MKNILVTGGSGYVGSALRKELGAHNVVNVDIGMFGGRTTGMESDFRKLSIDELGLFDTIIHLAGLSNDPMAHFSPDINFRMNAADTVDLAYKAKRAGVKRFIFASSASVYQGITSSERATPWNVGLSPNEPYAISKLMAERGIWCLMDGSFAVVILRKGTIGGASPRMRYDLVLNTMFRYAVDTGSVNVFVDRNGRSVMRPHLSIRDAVAAYMRALTLAPGTYNVLTRNLNIIDLAGAVAKTTGAKINRKEVTDSTLLRDYVMLDSDIIKSRESLSDTMRKMDESAPRDFDNPNYYNIEVWKKWVNQ